MLRIDGEIGRALAGARNEQARDPARGRRHHHQPSEMNGIAAVLRRDPGDDGAEKDGEEGPAFDQRVALGQLLAGKMVGQDAVFDRAEQGRDHAVQKNRDEQQDERMKGEARHGQRRDGDLEQLKPPRDDRLVEAVGHLAADTREEEERHDEGGAGKLNQCPRIFGADMEQDEKDQRGLEEVVAERREGLAPEQRRKTARRHQGRGHGSPAVFLTRHILAGRATIGDVDSRQRYKPNRPDRTPAAVDSPVGSSICVNRRTSPF